MELPKYDTKVKKNKYNGTSVNLVNFAPEDTDEIVHICDIIIPPLFKKSKTHGYKIKKAIAYYAKRGMLDKPISVIAETNEKGLHNKYLLIDEYSRYIACKKWMNISYVPVKYININDYSVNK